MNAVYRDTADSLLAECESVEAAEELVRLGADVNLNAQVIRLLIMQKEDVIK